VARIAALEPELRTLIAENPRVLDEAARARSGPLAGVPITVKDLILTRGIRTTAGSRTFGDGLPGTSDAPVIRRLKRAGAVILGKNNLHEVAMGVTTVNEHFGPTRNPWDRNRVSGGSSGGSAAAVAAGLGVASIGTDTRGSIRIPAACCGVTGFKPTYGLVETTGVIPLAPSLDHVGPITRSVEDAAVLLGVMAGWPRRAARWLQAVDGQPALRLGICEWFFAELDPAVELVVRDAVAVIAAAGSPVQPVEIDGLTEAHRASGVLTSAEALAFHADRLAAEPEGFGPLVRQRLEHGKGLTAVDYVRANQARALVQASFMEAFRRVDVLLAPVLPALPPPIGSTEVQIDGRPAPVLDAFTRRNSVANMGGLPACSVPCGFTPEGLPVGLQLIAAPNRDDAVLALGAWFQRETDWHLRTPPTIQQVSIDD
jgi:aspartyl-tRNA(Asn)/glutamyl-tRNA(Gln) amidotransferase subunit A